MNFLEVIKIELETLDLFTDIVSVGNLRDGNSISVSPAPSSFGSRYLNGQKEQNYSFQVRTKHDNTFIAYTTLINIQNYLESLTDLSGSFKLRKIEATTTTNWVEQTDQGQAVFTAIFNALLDEKEA